MKVLRPRSVDDALELYRRHPDAVPLAGGTDFMVAWNGGSENGRLILDLSAITSWQRIRHAGSMLRVGALRHIGNCSTSLS